METTNTNTNTNERKPSLYGRPNTLTDFKKIKKQHRNGQNPEQLKLKHDSRQELKNKLFSINVRPMSIMQAMRSGHKLPGRKVIPLGSFAYANPRIFHTLNRAIGRKQNFGKSEPTVSTTYLKTNNHGQYSSRCRYTRLTYTPMIQSWGYVVNPSHLFIRIDRFDGFISKLIKSPRGYHWEVDLNGIMLVSNTNPSIQYHPDAEDFLPMCDGRNDYFRQYSVNKHSKGYAKLFRYTPVSINHVLKSMVEKAKGNYTKAKEAAKLAKLQAKSDKELESDLKKLSKQGMTVCVKDSLATGNCMVGTMSWIGRVGIRSNHADPLTVWKLGKTTEPKRVTLVIYQAIRRHQAEQRRGYSILSEHYHDYPIKSHRMHHMEMANYEETNKASGTTSLIDFMHQSN